MSRDSCGQKEDELEIDLLSSLAVSSRHARLEGCLCLCQALGICGETVPERPVVLLVAAHFSCDCWLLALQQLQLAYLLPGKIQHGLRWCQRLVFLSESAHVAYGFLFSQI